MSVQVGRSTREPHSTMQNHTQRPSNALHNPKSGHGNRTVSSFAHRGVVQNSRLNPPSSIQSGPILKTSEPWQQWAELTVRVHNLPSTITTWDLWRRFAREGTVIFIELYENRQSVKDGKAQVRFCPPPNRALWTDNVTVPTAAGDGAYQVRVEPLPKKRSFQIQSPVRSSRWYPEATTIYPSTLDFGLMLQDMKMMTMFSVNTIPSWGEITFKIDLLRMRITCVFPVELTDPENGHSKGEYDRTFKYMFQIPFHQLQKVYRVEVEKGRWALIIVLENPPQFFRKQMNEKASHSRDALTWSEFDTWYRQTDIVYDPRLLQKAVVALHPDVPPVVDIGRWTTYRLVFEDARVRPDLYEQIKTALHDFNIEIASLENFCTEQGKPAEFWSIFDNPNINGELGIQSMATEVGHKVFELPFEVRYQLEVCISQGIFNEHNLNREFLTKLMDLAGKDAAKARDILEYIAERQVRLYEPTSIFDDAEALAYSTRRTIPHYCEYARKVTITPTTIYYSTPTVETSNRVVRHYSHYGDRFLRVQFTDEIAEGRINSCADKARNDQIFTRIYRTLSNGIRIGDRHYKFLAFGNSQFRENGAYFFSPVEQMTCENIRQWMGNFSELRTPAKYAARLGQCFSTTRAIRSTRVELVEIADVKRNGYCFTDGVGMISDFLAKIIASELGLPSTSPIPSAFQFRLGGCKGILAVSPDVRGQEVHIRQSQQKFKAIYNGLEIIRCSRYSSASLNRQTITILSSLGVADEVFTGMLTQQLSNYQSAMTDKSLALDLLGRYIDDNHMTITIAGMISDGFMSEKEPFLLSLLHLWRSWSIKLLKEKAKIIVENGAFLLGCTDETGTLRGHKNHMPTSGSSIKEDDLPQIFVSVPDKKNPGRYIVIEGICLLGRNPSLHPGDIRVVQAVDVPALHHLRDVVVFSQLGDRDVPSMCSGGDLDGDDFFVIWDNDLTPSEWNAQPMNYKAPKGEKLDRDVEIKDLTAFFVRYMKNDTLRSIAHAHLAQSDYLDQSVKDPKCLQLAELHSKAVDYVKSGVSAQMPKSLKPRRWPHFMEKNHKPKEQIYVSQKILGQLYDLVERVDFVPQYEAPFDKRILKAYNLPNSMLRDARQIKTQYDIAMRRILAQEEIKTEFEIWTAFALSKPRVGSDYKLQEHIGNVSAALKDRFRQICIDKVGSKDFKELGPFVAAMYRVTCEEMRLALFECRETKIVGGKEVPRRTMDPKYMPLISFPWLFHDILGRIATGIESREDFIGLGPSGLSLTNNATLSVEPTSRDESEELDFSDFVQTAEGITHRGELLDLFKPEDVDSDGDAVEQPYGSHHVQQTPKYPSNDSGEDEISELELDGFAGSTHQSGRPLNGIDPPGASQHPPSRLDGLIGLRTGAASWEQEAPTAEDGSIDQLSDEVEEVEEAIILEERTAMTSLARLAQQTMAED